jgi:hypothetical protein
MRDMNTIKADFAGRDVEFLVVNIYEEPESARRYIDATELKFDWMRADDAVVETLGIKSIPQLFVVDRDGTVVWRSSLLTTYRGGSDLRRVLNKLTH